jgi:DNA-binding CsgD family transcriptional regulator
MRINPIYCGSEAKKRGLTCREIEILQLMMNGLTSKQIAGTLAISYRTVEVHSGSIIVKLGASNKVHAIVIALRAGILSL